jgi:hypothetical protein
MTSRHVYIAEEYLEKTNGKKSNMGPIPRRKSADQPNLAHYRGSCPEDLTMSNSKNENIWDGILSDVGSLSDDDDDVTGKPRIPVPEPPPSTSGVEAQSISGASSTGSGKLATPRGTGITPAIPNATGTEMPPPSTVSIATAPLSTAGTA